MNSAICCVPVSPLRLEPSHRSEMVSQQLFGERCTITESAKDLWIKIKCVYDGYEAWCQESHVTILNISNSLEAPPPLACQWMNEVFYNDTLMVVPMGSSLTGLNNGVCTWGKNIVQFNGSIWPNGSEMNNKKILKKIAFTYLNTSYLWGGKSIFGIDCSGFTQTVYKFIGIALLRDAYQQATQGEEIGVLQESRFGDLAFFDNPQGKITHVGMLLNQNEIIHSSGKVRVDKIDREGIINTETGQLTHRLRVIKRYVGYKEKETL